MTTTSKLLAIACALAATAAQATDVAQGGTVFFSVSRAGHTINAYRFGASGPFFYRTHNFSTDYDGSPHAYHPNQRRAGALDYTANAGHPGNWFGIVTTNGRANGTPYIQGHNDPAPGFYTSSTSLSDPHVARRTDPRRYVDAEHVPYIVLPPKAQAGRARGGASLGDLAAVINVRTRAVAYAIFADSGPSEGLGEGSLALRQALGGRPNYLIWIVFPGSKRTPAWPQTVAAINAEGARRLAAFGGKERVLRAYGVH